MIHTYTLNGYNIVIDVNSGAVHSLDEVAYSVVCLLAPPLEEKCPEELIHTLQQYRQNEISEAYGELLALYREGLLFSGDDYIDIEKLQKGSSPVKALCLHVSHDCNLRCGYCFASTGDFGTGKRLNMTPDVACKAIDFVVKHSGARQNIEIDFFGGEPLIAFNTVKETVTYARTLEKTTGKCFHFTLTTNGMLLSDDTIAYINENMENVVLSLDGRREVNDRVRVRPGGGGSYDHIVPKFKKLVQQRNERDYYIRGTFTSMNTDFVRDVLHIADLGFKSISVEPAVAEKGSKYALCEEDLPVIFKQYEELACQILQREREGGAFQFFHMQIDLNQGPCIIKRLRGCGAGFEYMAVTPEGDLYPCHQFVGKTEFCLGNVEQGIVDVKLSERFAAENVYTRSKCRDCFARFYCSGGCSAANYNMNGDCNIPYDIGCELEKKRIECAIMLSAAREAKNFT